MNLRADVAFVLAAACLMVTPGLAASYKSPDGSLTLSARTIDVNSDRLIAVGKAHVHRADAVNKTTLDAEADKIVVVVASTPGGKAVKKSPVGKTAIKSADLTGTVKLVYRAVDANGVTSKITATSDNADFDGATNLAHLVGNVKITNENPALFAEPAVMAGDKATVNLTPNPGPDQFRFRVESSPGVSTITVTPKPKETQ